jgi:hypothetical protein
MTQVAKYYIYRNLRTGGFSVRYRGLVIDRLDKFLATGVQFQVSESGRRQVIAQGRKNVHAFVVAEKYSKKSRKNIDTSNKISYNPYTNSSFELNGRAIKTAKQVAFENGRCYVQEL